MSENSTQQGLYINKQTSMFDIDTQKEPDYVVANDIMHEPSEKQEEPITSDANPGALTTPETDKSSPEEIPAVAGSEKSSGPTVNSSAIDPMEKGIPESIANKQAEAVLQEYPEELPDPELEADPCILPGEEGGLDIDKQTRKFKHLCRLYIRRDRASLEKLLARLTSNKNDFFTAPASTKYHGAYPGGLCQHSIDVFECAVKLNDSGLFPEKLSVESICIAAMFHDICKMKLYKEFLKNVKNDRGEWVKERAYMIDEKFNYGGHGSKSVYIVQKFFDLLDEEAVAINCHMGFSDGSATTIRDVSNAYHSYPLAWLIHVADEAATFLVKREKIPKIEIKPESDS